MRIFKETNGKVINTNIENICKGDLVKVWSNGKSETGIFQRHSVTHIKGQGKQFAIKIKKAKKVEEMTISDVTQVRSYNNNLKEKWLEKNWEWTSKIESIYCFLTKEIKKLKIKNLRKNSLESGKYFTYQDIKQKIETNSKYRNNIEKPLRKLPQILKREKDLFYEGRKEACKIVLKQLKNAA